MKKYKGFTLIELLVVIAIIGLLSTLAVVALNSARSKSRDAKRIADIKQIQTALELYFNEWNSYPLQGTAGVMASGLLGTFMTLIPSAPIPADGTSPVCTDDTTAATTQRYFYNSTNNAGAACSASPCASYELQTCLGAKTGGLDAGMHCATPGGITNSVCAF